MNSPLDHAVKEDDGPPALLNQIQEHVGFLYGYRSQQARREQVALNVVDPKVMMNLESGLYTATVYFGGLKAFMAKGATRQEALKELGTLLEKLVGILQAKVTGARWEGLIVPLTGELWAIHYNAVNQEVLQALRASQTA